MQKQYICTTPLTRWRHVTSKRRAPIHPGPNQASFALGNWERTPFWSKFWFWIMHVRMHRLLAFMRIVR